MEERYTLHFSVRTRSGFEYEVDHSKNPLTLEEFREFFKKPDGGVMEINETGIFDVAWRWEKRYYGR